MSQQYDNTNRGVLFKNSRKQKETHPDYTGTINVDGVDYFLDAWLKDGAKGKFYSMSVKRKDKQSTQPAPARQGGKPPAPAIYEDVPFAPIWL